MANITLRILDGTDRGRVYENLATPITLGREEGNSIQLNDERVSRFHLKIQSDRDKVVLTDLQSTNGTKVNGEDVQVRILRHGDLISIGRSVVLFGSPQEINDRIAELQRQHGAESLSDSKAQGAKVESGTGSQISANPQDFDFELNWSSSYDYQHLLHQLQLPDLPQELSPAQTAQLSELLEYMHIRLRQVLAAAKIKGPMELVLLEYQPWQQLLDLQGKLAEYLKTIGDPRE
ncbi:MAG: FHA domain-containing protein [Pirellulales bacterium]|nr:FHA domain-containing protein [Pirellulales bacterium]